MKSVKRYDGKIEHCDNGGYVTFAEYKRLEASLENATGRDRKLAARIAELEDELRIKQNHIKLRDTYIAELEADGYEAQVAPVAVPDVLCITRAKDKVINPANAEAFSQGWNACRAKVLRLNSGSK